MQATAECRGIEGDRARSREHGRPVRQPEVPVEGSASLRHEALQVERIEGRAVWVACSCGAQIGQPATAPPPAPARTSPADPRVAWGVSFCTVCSDPPLYQRA
jgi:hypothetical protein